MGNVPTGAGRRKGVGMSATGGRCKGMVMVTGRRGCGGSCGYIINFICRCIQSGWCIISSYLNGVAHRMIMQTRGIRSSRMRVRGHLGNRKLMSLLATSRVQNPIDQPVSLTLTENESSAEIGGGDVARTVEPRVGTSVAEHPAVRGDRPGPHHDGADGDQDETHFPELGRRIHVSDDVEGIGGGLDLDTDTVLGGIDEQGSLIHVEIPPPDAEYDDVSVDNYGREDGEDGDLKTFRC